MNITDLVGQVLSHPLTTVTTLFLLFIGGSLIAIGSMGYIPAWKKDLSDTRATTCLWSGVGVLALSLFVGLASWAWKQPWPRGLVLGEFVGAFSMILVAIAAFVGAALVRSRLQELIAEEKHLKAAVEDATRHVLKGFPLIFDRALKLIEEAEIRPQLWRAASLLGSNNSTVH